MIVIEFAPPERQTLRPRGGGEVRPSVPIRAIPAIFGGIRPMIACLSNTLCFRFSILMGFWFIKNTTRKLSELGE